MSIFVVKDGKKVLPRSFYVKVLIFLSLIGLSAVAMQPLHEFLSGELRNIRNNLLSELEVLTGMEVHYASIRPSFFNSFEIRNLKFLGNQNQLLTISRVKINFSILELLQQKKTFVHTVLIDRPEINIDLERDRETLDIFFNLLKTDSAEIESDSLQRISQYLPRNADYKIQYGNFFLVNGDSAYTAEDVNFNIREEEGNILLFGRMAAEFKQRGLFDKTIIFRTFVGIDGVSDNNLHNVNANLSFFSFNCYEQDETHRNESFFNLSVNNEGSPRTLFSVLPFKIDITYADSIIRFSQHEESGAVYHFQYDFNTENINAAFNVENFRFTDKINFRDNFAFPGHLLNMSITGESSIEVESGAADFNIDLRGGNLFMSETAPLTDAFLIRVSGNNERINIRNFIVSVSENTASRGFFQGRAGFSGSIGINPPRPAGILTFDRFSLSGKEDLNVQFNVSSRGRDIQISAENVAIAEALIDSIDINIYPADREVGVSFSLFSRDTGSIFADAVYNRSPRQLEASLSLNEVSIFELTEMFRPFTNMVTGPAISRSFLQNSFIRTDVFFTTDFNNVIYNAPSVNFNLGDTKGMLSLSGTDRQFNLSEGLISRNGDEFLISANVNFSNPMDLNFNLNANFRDLAWNVDGQILDRSTLIVRDPIGLYIYGNIDNTGGISGYIEGMDFPVPAGAQPIFLNFYSTVRYNSKDFWNIDISRFTASESNAGNYSEFLRISGSADQDGASFREILYTDDTGILAGSADFSWDNDFSYLEFFVNITDGYEYGEYYTLEGSFKDSRVAVRAVVSNMHVNRFVNDTNPVTISGDINVIWESVDSFNANINLSSLKTRVNYEQMEASVRIFFDNNELMVRNLRLDYGGIRTSLPELQINRASGIAKARADFKGTALNKDLDASMELDVNFNKISSWMQIAQVINNFNGTLLLEDVSFGNLRQDRFIFEFASVNRAISLRGGINEMIRLEMDPAGNFFLGLSSPVPVRGTFVGTLKNGILDSSCNNFFIDLSTLYSLAAPPDDFNIIGGYITGQMDIRGPVINPEFYGSGIGTSMRFQVPNYLGADIRPVPFNIIAEGYEMKFGPAVTLCGNGGGTVNGWFFFQNWAPINVGLEINIPRESPIPYNFNITGFLAHGNASGNLNITLDGINQLLELSGNLFTNDAELGMNVDELAANTDEPEEGSLNSLIDLTITAGSMVEFIWPATNPIIRANPEMGTAIHVSVDTAAGQFSLNSDIRIRSGELYYLDRSYFIRQGNLVFKENETQFDPRFSARAEIRERTGTGPVTISMIVENQPLLSFEPRFEANPSLTQLEIYSILGQNFNNLEREDNSEQVRLLVNSTTDIAMQMLASSDVFSQFVFLRQFERGIRDTLGLDMFSVRTRLLQNAVLAGAGLGQDSAEGNNRLGVGNYFDNTTVFIGKYIGQHMFISGMLTIKYDENSNVLGGISIEPDIGIELQSPFLNIRWDFFPYSPENWWVTDNSITLSWSMSF